MTIAAFPPDGFVAAFRHIPRSQCAVQRFVPLLRQMGEQGCHIIEPGPYFFARTVRAARAANAAKYYALIGVASVAQPPYPLLAARHNLFRCQFSVFGLIPLGCNLRIKCCQVGLTGNCLFPCTVGTAASLYQRRWRDLPFVPSLTQPPVTLVGVGQYL